MKNERGNTSGGAAQLINDSEHPKGVLAAQDALAEIKHFAMIGDESRMVQCLAGMFGSSFELENMPTKMVGFLDVIAAYTGMALGGCVISIEDAGKMASGLPLCCEED